MIIILASVCFDRLVYCYNNLPCCKLSVCADNRKAGERRAGSDLVSRSLMIPLVARRRFPAVVPTVENLQLEEAMTTCHVKKMLG